MKKIYAAAALGAVPMVLSTAPVAEAYNTQNWWSSGSIPANYLPSHMTGSGLEDYVPSGEYCGTYTNYTSWQPDGADVSGNTGFMPPSPFSAYQVGDGHGSVCQAYTTLWGNQVSNNHPYCANTCGMQHFVSFQSWDIRPWAAAYGYPSLQLRSTFKPHSISVADPSVYGAWGYACAKLQDVTTGHEIEFCMDEWQPTQPNAVWPAHDRSYCGYVTQTGARMDMAIASYETASTYATPEGGYSGTVVGTGIGTTSGTYSYSANISSAQFKNAINDINARCGTGDSTDVTQYRLLGFEDGQEAWGTFQVLGAGHGQASVSTIY